MLPLSLLFQDVKESHQINFMWEKFIKQFPCSVLSQAIHFQSGFVSRVNTKAGRLITFYFLGASNCQTFHEKH